MSVARRGFLDEGAWSGGGRGRQGGFPNGDKRCGNVSSSMWSVILKEYFFFFNKIKQLLLWYAVRREDLAVY
jgi:hypothetical protein